MEKLGPSYGWCRVLDPPYDIETRARKTKLDLFNFFPCLKAQVVRRYFLDLYIWNWHHWKRLRSVSLHLPTDLWASDPLLPSPTSPASPTAVVVTVPRHRDRAGLDDGQLPHHGPRLPRSARFRPGGTRFGGGVGWGLRGPKGPPQRGT